MKTKISKLVALFATVPSILFAQVDPTTIERNNQPPSAITSAEGANANVDASDAGAQRPVFLKTENISVFGGVDSKVYYDDNPLSTQKDSILSTQKDAVWSNTAHLGAGLGQIEIQDAVITPYVGISYTKTEFLASNLDWLDYTSTNAYIMANIQHSNGWSYRLGVSYASDSNDLTDTETYSEFYPNMGVLKTYSHNEDILGIFNMSIGYHDTDADPSPIDPSFSRSYLDSFDVIGSYGIQYYFKDFLFCPSYSATYKTYTKDNTLHENNGREDLIHSLNLKIDYAIDNDLNISLFGGFSKRDTKDTGAIPYDFTKGTAGLALSLNTTF